MKYKFTQEFRVQLPLVYFYKDQSSLPKSNMYTHTSFQPNQPIKVPRKIPIAKNQGKQRLSISVAARGIFEIKTTSRKMRGSSIGPRVYVLCQIETRPLVHPHSRNHFERAKRCNVHTIRECVCVCVKRTWQSCAHCVFTYAWTCTRQRGINSSRTHAHLCGRQAPPCRFCVRLCVDECT